MLCVALGIYVQFRFANDTINTKIKENLELKSNEVVKEIENWLELQGEVIQSTGKALRFIENEEKILSLLEEQLHENDSFSSIYFGTPYNKMINASGWIPPQDFDLRTRPWYLGALEEDGLFYSRAFLNASKDEYIVTVALPVYDEKENVKGVVSGDITLNDMIDFANSHKVSDNGYTFILDREGNALSNAGNHDAHPFSSYNVGQISSELEEAIGKSQLGFINLDLEYDKGIAFYQKIPKTQWTIVGFVPEQDYLGEERRFVLIFFVVVFFTLSLVILLVNRQRKSIIIPLIELGKDIEEISIENNKGYRLPENEKDAFNKTRSLINQVLEKTQEYFAGLKENEEELLAANEELSSYFQQLKATEDTLMMEVDERKEAQKYLEMNLFLLSQTEEMVFVLDEDYKFVYGNQSFCQMTGLDKDSLQTGDLIGKDRILDENLLDEVKEIGYWSGEKTFNKYNRSIHLFIRINRLMYDKKLYYTCTLTDISSNKKNEKDLYYLKYFDQLTKLNNNAFFGEKLSIIFDEKSSTENSHALIIFNINKFREVNEVKGFSYGNELLKAFAERINELKDKEDNLIRMGNDEFLLLSWNVLNFDLLYSKVGKMYEGLTNGYYLYGEEVFINLSIGISLSPNDGKNLSEIYKSATTALGSLKSEESCGYRFYNKELNKNALENYDMNTRLRRAIEEERFLLYYQPKVCLKDKSIIGVEALVRMEENGKIISPAEFIHVAESTNLIIPIGEWVLKEACRFSYDRYVEGNELPVAVNISRLQFRNPYIIDFIDEVLSETKLPPHLLQLEITEGILMENTAECGYLISTLKERGVTLSIDDFGTGYSSLAYLKEFDMNQLKIDRSFVKDIPFKDNGVIAKVIIELANNFGMEVVAEGIENEKQEEFLLSLGCEIGQGYFYYRPMDEEGIKSLMNTPDT